MILFFQSPTKTVLAVEAAHAFSPEDVEKLVWAFSEAKPLQAETLEGWYVGPRREMITPWSTNAVEITQNMGLTGISRIEEYFPVSSGEAEHDPMLQRIYDGLNQDIFTISKQPDPIVYIEDIEAYNKQEGLALSDEEVAYLNEVSQKLERPADRQRSIRFCTGELGALPSQNLRRYIYYRRRRERKFSL